MSLLAALLLLTPPEPPMATTPLPDQRFGEWTLFEQKNVYQSGRVFLSQRLLWQSHDQLAEISLNCRSEYINDPALSSNKLESIDSKFFDSLVNNSNWHIAASDAVRDLNELRATTKEFFSAVKAVRKDAAQVEQNVDHQQRFCT